MHNREIYRKIKDVTCTNKDLISILKNIDDVEFDIENPFDKYYDLRSVLIAIMKYKRGEVNVKFFTNWIKTYYHILVGGINAQLRPEITLKGSLKWAILDCLGKLMFYNEFYDSEDLKIYINAFLTFGRIYREIDECTAIFSECEGVSYDVVGIIFNSKRRYFMKIFMRSEKYLFDDLQLLDESEIERQELALNDIGYRQLYYLYEDKTI